nr:MAG TPA_asm: hypothetical protein [Bacteriophage sp.]
MQSRLLPVCNYSFLSPQSKLNHFMFDFLQHLFLLFFKTLNFTQNITNTKDNQIPVTLTFCSMRRIIFTKSFTQTILSCNQVINCVFQNTLIFFSHFLTSIFVKCFIVLVLIIANRFYVVFQKQAIFPHWKNHKNILPHSRQLETHQ